MLLILNKWQTICTNYFYLKIKNNTISTLSKSIFSENFLFQGNMSL
jgi:hypothetical protein